MDGLEEVLNGLRNVIEFFKVLFQFFASIFKATGVALRILLEMTVKIYTWIATLPAWINAFALITITISLIYFIVGREVGKSD